MRMAMSTRWFAHHRSIALAMLNSLTAALRPSHASASSSLPAFWSSTSQIWSSISPMRRPLSTSATHRHVLPQAARRRRLTPSMQMLPFSPLDYSGDDLLVAHLIDTKVHPMWLERLKKLERPAAKELIPSLRGENIEEVPIWDVESAASLAFSECIHDGGMVVVPFAADSAIIKYVAGAR
mmetsp:Transcript_17983/g.43244  ORF Transcript_17983/g.43244 Transcript_17983/m.43244 type:complete len:181 (-) Transcript_17983:1041-1583(-)